MCLCMKSNKILGKNKLNDLTIILLISFQLLRSFEKPSQTAIIMYTFLRGCYPATRFGIFSIITRRQKSHIHNMLMKLHII